MDIDSAREHYDSVLLMQYNGELTEINEYDIEPEYEDKI